jgi:hypothetical protein
MQVESDDIGGGEIRILVGQAQVEREVQVHPKPVIFKNHSMFSLNESTIVARVYYLEERSQQNALPKVTFGAGYNLLPFSNFQNVIFLHHVLLPKLLRQDRFSPHRLPPHRRTLYPAYLPAPFWLVVFPKLKTFCWLCVARRLMKKMTPNTTIKGRKLTKMVSKTI